MWKQLQTHWEEAATSQTRLSTEIKFMGHDVHSWTIRTMHLLTYIMFIIIIIVIGPVSFRRVLSSLSFLLLIRSVFTQPPPSSFSDLHILDNLVHTLTRVLAPFDPVRVAHMSMSHEGQRGHMRVILLKWHTSHMNATMKSVWNANTRGRKHQKEKNILQFFFHSLWFEPGEKRFPDVPK